MPGIGVRDLPEWVFTLDRNPHHPFWKRFGVFRYYEPPKEAVRVPGWPGPASRGAALAYNLFILPLTYAKVCTGQMTTAQALAWAAGELKKAYGKGG